MNPIDFPESNANFGPPPDVTESQVATVRAGFGRHPNQAMIATFLGFSPSHTMPR